MPLDEFIEQPLIQGDNMFKKIIEICIARIGKQYCGLSVHPVVSKFDGKLSSLYYNIVDAQDSNCQITSPWMVDIPTAPGNFAKIDLMSN